MRQRDLVRSTRTRPTRAVAFIALLALGGCESSTSPGADGGKQESGTGGASAGSSAAGAGGFVASAGSSVSIGGGALGVGGSSGNGTGGALTGGVANGGESGGGGAGPVAGSGGRAGAGGFSGMLGASGSSGSAGAAGGVDKLTLFDGKDLSQWKSRNGGGNAPWQVMDNAFSVVPNSGDIETRESFGDVQLHVEFWIPKTPTTNEEQDRGNSGIYLQGRYEVQVLDSYMHPLDGANDCGAIYELKNADVNASLPPENWQTYEITFRAPRWQAQKKLENAKISVTWNGQQAQKDVEVPAPTRLGDPEVPGDAPLRLQDHGHNVRYRNIWLQKL